jgi:hypothetical protein
MKFEFPDIYEVLQLEGQALYKEHSKLKKNFVKKKLAESHKQSESIGFDLFMHNPVENSSSEDEYARQAEKTPKSNSQS